MKTIPMPRRVLTEHFHKIVAILTLFVLILCSCNTSYIYEIIRYDSSNEVLDIFIKNKDEFKCVLDILDDPTLYSYVEEKKFDAGLWDNLRLKIIKTSGLITKEEFDKVESFFKKFGPVNIDKRRRHKYSSISFKINCLSSEFYYSGITIYYIEDINTKSELDDTIGYLEQFGDEIVNIIDHWYYTIDNWSYR